MDMDTRLITILRRPDGLFGLLTSRHAAFERPTPPKEVDDGFVLSAPEEGPYFEEIRPLADVQDTLAYRNRLLLQSWQALQGVTVWNAEVLANVLHVLIDTIADPAADVTDVPTLVVFEPAASPRPTAAHPRAYQGTKYKPPKVPRPGPVDLRPHLCRAGDEGRILERLSSHFDEAVARVERDHSYGEVLRSRGRESLRPYAQCWPSECRKEIAALPAVFRRNLLWSLRACEWEQISGALSAYWALGLDQDIQLRCCISTLLSIHPMRQMVDWCHVIARMPPHRRIHFTELLIESSAYWTAPDDQTIEGLTRADSLSVDAVYRHRMHYALCSVKERADLCYANDGFELANAYRMNHEFEGVASLERVAPVVKRFAEYVADAEDWCPASAMTLWERCSELDGLKELLDDPVWRRLDAQSASKLVHIFISVVYEELDDEALEQKWNFLRDRAMHLLEFVATTGRKYRPKALNHLSELIWDWDDPKDLRRVLEPFFRLSARVCRSPFKEHGFGHSALSSFTVLPADEWRNIEQAQDASFRKLESACARKNDAWLVGRGLWSLCEFMPRLVAIAFAQCPQQLLKLAQTLGVMDVPARRQLIQCFGEHPLQSANPAELKAEQLVGLVKGHLQSGVSNPIPKRLREHLLGDRVLQPAQVERDAAIVRESWLALQLDVFNQLAFDQMSTGLPETERTGKVKHALMLQQTAEEHRRSLRQLLRAYLGGRRGYVEDHPKNREWLERHPRVEPSKWLQGMSYRSIVPGQDILNLSIEHDALEVLRLGSYFATCLGVGGGLSYSAAAIALDINKRVVYARNAAGRVVARQLLALSEDDQLICFTIYPKRIGTAIRSAFKEFDVRFAAHLGLRVYEPANNDEGDDGYKIASIVSRDFWDDDAWDLNTKD